MKIERGTVVPAIVILAILAAFMSTDRLWLHVYSPDVGSLRQQLRQHSAAAKDAQDAESRDVLDLQQRISGIDKNVQNAVNTQTADSSKVLRDYRISGAIAILSLLKAYGGTQSSGSPAGRACVDYLVNGTGSVTDCGFQHVAQ